VGQTYYPNDDKKEEQWTHARFTMFKFGDTQNLEMLFCFGRQCKYGVVLEEENGKGPHGISIGFGVEDIPQGATLKVNGNNGFQFVNASLLSDNTTVDFNTKDSLSLFNSRTKNSAYFFRSRGKGGKLFFNQVLHRGDNTIVEAYGDHLEVVNSIFFDGLWFDVRSTNVPHVFSGGYLKSDSVVTNSLLEEVSLSFLEKPYEMHSSIKLNLDLFIYPNKIFTDQSLKVKEISDKGFICYPNPATNLLNIKADGQQVEKLRVYNIQGKLVFDCNPNKSLFSIPVAEFGQAGLYLVQAVINGKRKIRVIQVM